MLAKLLTTTGELGYPFEPFADRESVRAVRARSVIFLNEAVRRARTANGIYGLKVFAHHFDQIAPVNWAEVLPDPQFIHFQRLDLLGQALSAVRAMQTGQFEAGQPTFREPFYDRRRIAAAVWRIAHNQVRWMAWFARNGIRPLALTYEELIEDPVSVIRRVAALLEVPIKPREVVELPMRMQRDDLTAEWRDRYLSESRSTDYLDDDLFHVRPLIRRMRDLLR